MKGLEIGNALKDFIGFGIQSGSQSGEQSGDSKHDQTRGWGWMDGQTNEQTNKHTENLPILQDFVPYWGHYPASPYEN